MHQMFGIMAFPVNETENYRSSYLNIEPFGYTYLRINPKIW